jgi:hypothetical protein
MQSRTPASVGRHFVTGFSVILLVALTTPSRAEDLFGYIRGAETLPKGEIEVKQWLTQRSDKGQGSYRAIDSKTEIEYGVTDRFQVIGEINAQSVRTEGLLIDGYIPGDNRTGLLLSGVEFGAKYNFLSPAKDDFGLSAKASVGFGRLDRHSGHRKREVEVDLGVQAQKYFMEGQLVWVGNANISATVAKRAAIANLPAGFEWPTTPENEINLRLGTGLSYRFAPGWSAAFEAVRESEYETEIGLERWSLFAGPSIHWAGRKWWITATWFQQLRGGGLTFAGQTDTRLHLIEKTKNEVRVKFGYDF